jgi:hypothetical protein
VHRHEDRAREQPYDPETRRDASALARGGVELSEIHLRALELRQELRELSLREP